MDGKRRNAREMEWDADEGPRSKRTYEDTLDVFEMTSQLSWGDLDEDFEWGRIRRLSKKG